MNFLQPNAKQPIASRIISVPDGPDQMVSLQVGWWECLDWMVEKKGVALDNIASFCWRHVETYPGEDFACCLENYLHCFMQDHFCESKGIANNNYQEPQTPMPDHTQGMPPIRRILVSSRIKMLLKTYRNKNDIKSFLRSPANDCG